MSEFYSHCTANCAGDCAIAEIRCYQGYHVLARVVWRFEHIWCSYACSICDLLFSVPVGGVSVTDCVMHLPQRIV